MKKKILVPLCLLLFAVFLAAALSTTYATGTEFLLCENVNNITGDTIDCTSAYPASGAVPSAAGNTFNATVTCQLTSVSFALDREADFTIVLSAMLFNMTGTYGSSGTVGDMLAYSNYYMTDDLLTTDMAWYNFTFERSNNTMLYANTKYVLVVYCYSGTGHVNFWWGNDDVDFGEQVRWASGAWGRESVGAGNLMGMKIYADSAMSDGSPEPTASPGPLPTGGSYDTSDIDQVINTLAGYMIPLVLFLLPAIVLGYMTKWAMWPILIGLAIGAGLTYLFLGTQYVWLVFLVACGIGGAIYKGRGTN